MIVRPRSWTFRYRVVDLNYLSEPDETINYRGAGFGAVREYRTLAKAEQRMTELASAGRVGVLQVGVLQWMTGDDAIAEAHRLTSEDYPLE